MVALALSSYSMAAALKDRLSKMDQAIELMQGLRKETATLVAEFFPESV